MHWAIAPFWYAIGCTFWSQIVFYIQLNGSHNDDPSKTSAVYDFKTIWLITLASVFSFFGQVFQSRAFQLEKTARVAALSYL